MDEEREKKEDIEHFSRIKIISTRLFPRMTKIFDRHLEFTVKTIKEGEVGRKKKIIIDFGCNDGRHTLYLSSLGFKVFGIDRCEGAVRRYEEDFFVFGRRVPKKNLFVLGDADLPPIKKGSVDVILLFGVLHHNPKNFKRIIDNMYECLKERGLLIIQEPNGESILRPIIEIFGRLSQYHSKVERPIPHKELILHLQEKFKIKEIIYYDFISSYIFFLTEFSTRIKIPLHIITERLSDVVIRIDSLFERLKIKNFLLYEYIVAERI